MTGTPARTVRQRWRRCPLPAGIAAPMPMRRASPWPWVSRAGSIAAALRCICRTAPAGCSAARSPVRTAVIQLRNGRVARRYLHRRQRRLCGRLHRGRLGYARPRHAAGPAQPNEHAWGDGYFGGLWQRWLRRAQHLLRPNTRQRQPAQHPCPLRSGQRVLRRMARPVDDLLVSPVRGWRGRSRRRRSGPSTAVWPSGSPLPRVSDCSRSAAVGAASRSRPPRSSAPR